MRVRFLLAMLLAMAMSLAPAAVAAHSAMAAEPAHHAAMASDAHCPDQPEQDPSGQEQVKPCCAAGCMASATLPARAAEPLALARPVPEAVAQQFHRGHIGEIATPPPRFS